MANVLITGGTGMIGSALSKALVREGHEVCILTRDPQKGKNNDVHYAAWNPEGSSMDKKAVQEADYLIHLAGANVAEARWTKKRKQEIRNSRIATGTLIVKTLKEVPNKIRAVISASAIGYYGPDPVVPNPHPFEETDAPANDFLGKTVKDWEDAIQPVEELGKRLVLLRTGIVLSTEGGAYPEFRKPTQFGLATILGNGKQVISWIHIDDLVRLYIYAMQHEQWKGMYNAVSLKPVSNREMILKIARSGKHFFLPVPVPAFALKAALGELSVEVLKSATVSAGKVLSGGFDFRYPTIDTALKQLRAS